MFGHSKIFYLLLLVKMHSVFRSSFPHSLGVTGVCGNVSICYTLSDSETPGDPFTVRAALLANCFLGVSW